MSTPQIEDLLDVLAERVADRVARRLLAGASTDPDWIDQTRTPLGKRRHCRVVRERIARGEPGAAIVGRRHVLSRSALEIELSRVTPGKKDHGAKVDLLNEYRKRKAS